MIRITGTAGAGAHTGVIGPDTAQAGIAPTITGPSDNRNFIVGNDYEKTITSTELLKINTAPITHGIQTVQLNQNISQLFSNTQAQMTFTFVTQGWTDLNDVELVLQMIPVIGLSGQTQNAAGQLTDFNILLGDSNANPHDFFKNGFFPATPIASMFQQVQFYIEDTMINAETTYNDLAIKLSQLMRNQADVDLEDDRRVLEGIVGLPFNKNIGVQWASKPVPASAPSTPAYWGTTTSNIPGYNTDQRVNGFYGNFFNGIIRQLGYFNNNPTKKTFPVRIPIQSLIGTINKTKMIFPPGTKLTFSFNILTSPILIWRRGELANTTTNVNFYVQVDSTTTQAPEMYIPYAILNSSIQEEINKVRLTRPIIMQITPTYINVLPLTATGGTTPITVPIQWSQATPTVFGIGFFNNTVGNISNYGTRTPDNTCVFPNNLLTVLYKDPVCNITGFASKTYPDTDLQQTWFPTNNSYTTGPYCKGHQDAFKSWMQSMTNNDREEFRQISLLEICSRTHNMFGTFITFTTDQLRNLNVHEIPVSNGICSITLTFNVFLPDGQPLNAATTSMVIYRQTTGQAIIDASKKVSVVLSPQIISEAAAQIPGSTVNLNAGITPRVNTNY